ncbi:MAG: hypothetical protein J7K46_03370 [Bacteroidales bacterium]|nr:hypothetical protein [Bacteroidales bacterium]
MKTISKTCMILMGTLLLGVTLSSCEKIKSLADVKFNSELGTDLNVTIGSGTEKSVQVEGYTFSESADVSLHDDQDIDKYFDKLKGFDVQEVTGTVKSVIRGPVTISNGKLSIGSGSSVATWLIKNFQVETNATLTLDNNGGQWDIVNGILNDKKDFTVTVEGKTDKDNVSFTLHVVVKVKVTANPL